MIRPFERSQVTLARWALLGTLASLSAVAAAHVVDNSVAPGQPVQGPSIDRATTATIVHVTIPKLPIEALVTGATDVVHGRIQSVTPVLSDSAGAHTVYELEVYSALTGDASGVMTFLVGGAFVQGRGVIVPDAPTFEPGEAVVLLLWTDPKSGQSGLLGLGQGVFRVSPQASGAPLVHGQHAAPGTTLPDLFSIFESILFAAAEAQGR